MKAFLQRYRFAAVAALLLAGVFAVAAVLAWQQQALWMPEAVRLRDASLALLREVHPAVFFMLLATVPVIPVPIMPFYLTAAIYPIYVSLPGLVFAISFNLAISYWLGNTLLRPLALRVLRRSRFNLPQVTPRNERMVNLIVRISGLPFTAQNYLCALSGVSFRSYMLVGVPLQVVSAAAIMLLSDSVMKGRIGSALAGVGLLVAIGLGVNMARKKLGKRRLDRAEPIAEQGPGADSIGAD